MTLLADVVGAAGGMEQWRQFRNFSAQVSIGGQLMERKFEKGALKDIAIEGSTIDQSVQIIGFPAPDLSGIYRPDWVAIEAGGGAIQSYRRHPREAFLDHGLDTAWDPLHVVYYCGLAIWNYMTSPFLLTRQGMELEELPPFEAGGEMWRRLKVVFPPQIATQAREQVFYYDRDNLQRRMDYVPAELGGAPVAQLAAAHQEFSGIVVPTLRRARKIGPEGVLAKGPACLDVEIFDACFT